MADGPLSGLLARAVIVVGKDGKIAYTELVPEITQEPDYERRLRQLGNNRLGLNYTIKTRWMKKDCLYPPFLFLFFCFIPL